MVSTQAPVLYSQLLGQSVLDPYDKDLQKRVQGSFWVKLQRNEVADPESNYRLLAINILERAREKGYSVSDMERACTRFETTQMFGDRIEISAFFESEPEKLFPYSWVQKLHADGKAQWYDFDGYLIVEDQPLRWRKHDGKVLEGLTLAVFAGKSLVEQKVSDNSRMLPPPITQDSKELIGKMDEWLSSDVLILRRDNDTLKGKNSRLESEKRALEIENEMLRNKVIELTNRLKMTGDIPVLSAKQVDFINYLDRGSNG